MNELMTEQDLATKIRAEHSAFTAAAKHTIEHALTIGDLLIRAKEKAGYGNWLPWLAEHCPNISERHARNFMAMARHRAHIEGKSATVADLTIREALALIAPRF